MTEEQLIQDVISILESNGRIKTRYAAVKENFRNRLINARSQTFRLGIIGVTSSGKSTLINALMQEALLPSLAKPSSSQLVTCHKGPERQAIIYFENGKTSVYKGHALNQEVVCNYGDETRNPGNRKGVRQIEIIAPAFPFSPEMLLIDSPGLDAYGLESHEELTMTSLLPTVDFCIFLTTCKTNSDSTMKDVLNVIARYNKPLIIVQNMIDTLRGSADGRKSPADVAQEHLMRIGRVVENTDIKDKGSVAVVQVSAIEAMKKTPGQPWPEASHFEELIRTITAQFEQIRPAVSQNRLKILKDEITRIAEEAITDASPKASAEDAGFQYASIPAMLTQDIETGTVNVKKELENFESLVRQVSCTTQFSESALAEIKKGTENITASICKSMTWLNGRFSEIAATLNVDSRDIFASFSVTSPDLKIQRKTVEKREWVPGKRLWYTLWIAKSEGHWKTWKEIENDHDATRRHAHKHLASIRQNYAAALEKWQESLSRIEKRLLQEIENRRKAHELRRSHILDAREALKVGHSLKNIADAIRIRETVSTPVRQQATTVKSGIRTKKTFPKLTLNILDLSRQFLNNFRFRIMQAFLNSSQHPFYIFGKDKDSVLEFRDIWFHDRTRAKMLDSTFQPIKDYWPVFLLVNASQPGAAQKELAGLKLATRLESRNLVIFVVQDMLEIINGGTLGELPHSLRAIRGAAGIGNSAFYFLHHSNPLIPMAALEMQRLGRKSLQRDETAMISAFEKKFPFLFSKVEKIIPQLLRHSYE